MQENRLNKWVIAKNNPPSLTYAAQIAVGSLLSYFIARLFRLPEAYWAPMSTLIVMQTTFDAALPISAQYFAGTAAGAAIGALTESYFHGNVWAFGVALYLIGLLCVALRLERSAYRYAAMTLMVVMLVTRSINARAVALHRFFEVSIGIVVGLLLFHLWEKLTPDIWAPGIKSAERGVAHPRYRARD